MQKHKGLVLGLVCMIALFPFAASASAGIQMKIDYLRAQLKAVQEAERRSQSASVLLTEDPEPSIPENLRNTDESGRPMQATNGGQQGNGDQNRREERNMNFNGTSTPSMNNGNGDANRSLCAPVIRNLTIGSKGDDVRELQKILFMDPTLLLSTTTGFFGKETARAMMLFQMKNGIATSTTGEVGPRTREFFKRQCASPRALEVRHEGDDRNASSTATSTRPLPPPPRPLEIHHDGDWHATTTGTSTRPLPPPPAPERR